MQYIATFNWKKMIIILKIESWLKLKGILLNTNTHTRVHTKQKVKTKCSGTNEKKQQQQQLRT